MEKALLAEQHRLTDSFFLFFWHILLTPEGLSMDDFPTWELLPQNKAEAINCSICLFNKQAFFLQP